MIGFALLFVGVTLALEIRRETAFVGYSERPGMRCDNVCLPFSTHEALVAHLAVEWSTNGCL
jgi:hypothetical protein